MGLMDGKRGLVVGVANDHSYAYFIAESLVREGAECLFTHLPGERMERRARKAIEQIVEDGSWLMPMDASSDEDLDKVFAKVAEDFGSIDFLVHSIAFADLRDLGGEFINVSRSGWNLALEISAYSFIQLANHAAAPNTTAGAGG